MSISNSYKSLICIGALLLVQSGIAQTSQTPEQLLEEATAQIYATPVGFCTKQDLPSEVIDVTLPNLSVVLYQSRDGFLIKNGYNSQMLLSPTPVPSETKINEPVSGGRLSTYVFENVLMLDTYYKYRFEFFKSASSAAPDTMTLSMDYAFPIRTPSMTRKMTYNFTPDQCRFMNGSLFPSN